MTLYQRYLLTLALLAVLVSNMDRYVVSILMEQIKSDLTLTDTQLGWLVGPAFVIIHVVFQLPLARLADRWNRKNMIAVAMGLWSLLTVAAGYAKTFPMLLITRMGVGITEAGCSPPLASLLSSYFSPQQRGKAMSIFTVGAISGIGAGMLLGGFLGREFGWRVALIATGIPGVVLALIFFLTVREPARESRATEAEKPSLITVLGILLRRPTYVWLIIGTSCLSMTALGRSVWEPVFLMRTFGLDQAAAGLTYFLISPIPSLIGALLGGMLADRLSRFDLRWYMWLPALGMAVAFPTTIAFLWLPIDIVVAGTAIPLAFVFSVAGSFFAGMASPATIATAQNLSPPEMRATAHAIWTMASNLIGMGLGPLLVGILSDHWQAEFGSDALRFALLSVSSLALVAAIAFFIGARGIRNDLLDTQEARCADTESH